MTDFNNQGFTEGTNFMVDMLANSDKIEPEHKRWNFDKNNDDVDDNFNDYVSHHDDNKTQNNINDNNNDNNDNNYDNYDNVQTNNNTYNITQAQSESKTQQSDSKPKSDTNKFIDEEYESLSPLEKRLRRLDIMRSLGELRDLGCKVTNYNIDDDYYMMKYELDLHRSIRSKRNWLGLYSHMLIGGIKFVELINNNYNPFDFSLKGLSDEVNADKNTYYEILGEIYEYHNVPGKKMNPWFRLFVSLIGVVVVVGGKNNAHKFMPNKSKKLEEDEDYIETLRARAAKDSQSKLSNKSNQQNNQNQKNNLDDYMNRQHEHAVQKTRDLEELKRQELEYQRYQQMLVEQKQKFNNMKKSLEMSASARSVSERNANVLSSANSKSSLKSSLKSPQQSSKSSKSSRQSRQKEQDTISEMSTNSTKTTQTTQTSQSTVSQISINKNLARKLNNDNKKKSKDITMDQISFGSNKKR